MIRTNKVSDLKPFEGLTISSWEKVQKDFFKAMQADRKGVKIARVIVSILVALGVFNTILMATLERTREFGVLKAIGSSSNFLGMMIVLESLLIGVLGIIGGLLVSLGVNYYFHNFGIVISPPIEYGGFKFTKMSAVMNLTSYLLPSLVMLATTFFVSLFPAYKVGRISPVEAMRI